MARPYQAKGSSLAEPSAEVCLRRKSRRLLVVAMPPAIARGLDAV
jgi:hypothetical protein